MTLRTVPMSNMVLIANSYTFPLTNLVCFGHSIRFGIFSDFLDFSSMLSYISSRLSP